ncbi:hypothetical protein H4Q26_008574 [Puccinia striiformis f. sp. tritici PST-130]|nr:hypothetical protein H4Q26_008574 [Puccinia striiformis f. sp. tritici PST-130]
MARDIINPEDLKRVEEGGGGGCGGLGLGGGLSLGVGGIGLGAGIGLGGGGGGARAGYEAAAGTGYSGGANAMSTGGGAGYGVGESQSSGYSYSSSSQSSSMTYQSMMGACSGLVKKINTCQNSFGGPAATGGSMQQNFDAPIQAIQGLSAEIQTVLSNFHSCSECTGNQIVRPTSERLHAFGGTFNQIFLQLQQLFNSCRMNYPNHWTSMMKTGLCNVDEVFSNFFSACQQKGLYLRVFIPVELGSLFNQCGLQKLTRLWFNVVSSELESQLYPIFQNLFAGKPPLLILNIIQPGKSD